MNRVLSKLEPKDVFSYFEDICNIPHVSYHTEEIRSYIEKFAINNNFKYVKDEAGNIVIFKPASLGYENHPAVILQGHIDMVGAKKDDSKHDFLTDSIQLQIDEGFIHAKDTTLGGDDGIAVAYGLAILANKELQHPALEVVFTTNEEVGLLGANAFDYSVLSGKILLNLDSEDEGIFLMGSAGGMRADIDIPVFSNICEGIEFSLSIQGLLGGHSGDKIGTGRPSANVLMGRVLDILNDQFDYCIETVLGGVVDNAISTKCVMTGITNSDPKAIIDSCKSIEKDILQEYLGIDDNISIFVEFKSEAKKECLSKESFNKLIMALRSYPQGVISRNSTNVELVETSLNLGIINASIQGIKLGYSLRSSIESAKKDIAKRVRTITEFLGGSIIFSGDYPAWTYNPVSKVRPLIGDIYRKQTGKEPVFKTIHAGLECGLFYNKLEDLDIVSYGPDLYDIHTFDEKLDIASAKRVFELTIELLSKL